MFAVHSIEYDAIESFLYIFAALEDSSLWLSWDNITDLAVQLGIPTVPVVARRHVSTHAIPILSSIVPELVCGFTSVPITC